MSAPDPFVLSKALDWLAEGRRVALATVIQTWGSAPQPVGSQLVIDADGNFLGSVSGGCVEAEVITEAADVIATGEPKALEFGVEDNTAWSVGLACGGAIRIFVESLAPGRGHSPDGVLHRLISDVGARHKVALVTHLATGARSLAHSPEDSGQDLAPALEDAFRRDRSVALEGSDGEVFINVFNPTIRLVIVGAVHVAQPLVPMARALGYDVVIVDPRTAFATEERFGDVEISREWPDEALPKIGMDGRTALIALTHDPKIDDPALICALSSDAFYVGALGSKKTHAKRIERLIQAGVPSAQLDRIHAPIGLDIGAQGAAEIAVSIIAEITAVQRGKGKRPPMRATTRPSPARAGLKVAAIVLAAGRSSRMAPRNKLLELVEGKPIIARVAGAALASGANPVIVVSGFEAPRIADALHDLKVTIVHNPAFEQGLSTSLRTGLRALPADTDGVLILLGDMPEIESGHLETLMTAFAEQGRQAICVPVRHGKRGNPVLWGAAYFAEIMTISGDVGAKQLMARHQERVSEVAVGSDGIFADVDTLSDLARLKTRIGSNP